jgi:hypothetical protein
MFESFLLSDFVYECYFENVVHSFACIKTGLKRKTGWTGWKGNLLGKVVYCLVARLYC